MVDTKQLMESMKVCDKFRSRSSLDLGLSVIHTHFSGEQSLPLGYLFESSIGRGNQCVHK